MGVCERYEIFFFSTRNRAVNKKMVPSSEGKSKIYKKKIKKVNGLTIESTGQRHQVRGRVRRTRRR